MRKLFLIVVSMLFMFAACQKEEIVSPDSGRGQTITVNIPQAGVATRAAGDGTQINRCILEIYRNGALYGERRVVAVSGKTATFNDLRLVSNQTYDFVFWADCATEGVDGALTDKHYNTESLDAITVSDYAGNNDEFDAFFHCEKNYKVTQAFNLAVSLKRPFGQLNVTTTDWNQIPDEDLKPTNVKVEFASLANTFNALTGVASGDDAVSYEAAVADAATGALTVDYIFASEDEGATLVDYTMTFLNNSVEISKNDAFTNIPVRRNYKTNVKGNLLTKGGEFNVTIDPTFNTPDIDKELGETATVATVTDVEEAIKNGAREIIVESAPTEAAVIEIPHTLTEEQAAEKVTITVPATDKDITIKYTTDQSGDATQNIELFVETTGTLVLDLPQSTVTLRGSVGSLEATTAENTLIVPEGITVGNLIVNGGNVEIYGDVQAIEFKNEKSLISVYGVKTVEKLKEAVTFVEAGKCARIVLGADLDLAGSKENPWKPIDTENKKFVEFDGAGHTISNLYVDNYTGQTDKKGTYYGGFFYVLQGDVKNLTLQNPVVTCFRGGALVGRMDYGTIENCHIKNVTLNGWQKVAGLVGFVNVDPKDLTISNCSVDKCAIKTVAPDEVLYQAGGLIGFLSTTDRNVLIESNSVSGISFDKVYESAPDVVDEVYDMEQLYSHAFIGTISNYSDKSIAYYQHKVELKNNTVAEQVSGIPTCDRTDGFIGWWGGDYNYDTHTYAPKIIVDGQEKDRWIEVERLVARLREGGDIIVWRNYDFTKWPGSKTNSQQIVENPIEITKPTNITIKKGATWTVGKQQLVNKSELHVKSEGVMSATDYIFMNEGGATLNIENGTFTSTKATDANGGVVIYNQGICNIKNGTFDGQGFTLMNTGNANMTIDGGWVKNGGKGTSYALMGAGGGVKITINDGKIEALQSIGGALVTINGGTVVNDSKYYAIYNQGGNTVVNGGYICGASGYNDVYIAGGKVDIKGGYFEDNKVSAAQGFVYKEKVQTVDGVTYNWEVVAE